MDGTQVGLIGIGTGIVGLLIAAMLYKKIDSIKIENETVAKITQRIQDGAMAFLYAEYRMLAVFVVVVAGLLYAGGIVNDDLGLNTMVAFIIGVFLVLVFYMLDKTLVFVPHSIAGIIQFLAVDYHLSNISRGVIDSRNLIYFFSMIGFFIFLTIQTLEVRRWK